MSLVPGGLPVRCLTASDLAQAGTQTGLRFFSRAVLLAPLHARAYITGVNGT